MCHQLSVVEQFSKPPHRPELQTADGPTIKCAHPFNKLSPRQIEPTNNGSASTQVEKPPVQPRAFSRSFSELCKKCSPVFRHVRGAEVGQHVLHIREHGWSAKRIQLRLRQHLCIRIQKWALLATENCVTDNGVLLYLCQSSLSAKNVPNYTGTPVVIHAPNNRTFVKFGLRRPG